MASEADVRAALSRIVDPSSGQDILSSGLVQSLAVGETGVSFVLQVDPAKGNAMEPLRAAAENAVKALGVETVRAVLTAHSATAGWAASTSSRAPVDSR